MSVRLAPRTMRARVRYLYLALLVFGVLGVTFAIVTFRGLYEGQKRLTDELSPSAIEAEAWLVALVDQARGLRGYLLTADPVLLDEYGRGGEDASESRIQVREFLEDHPDLLASLDDVEAAIERWQDDIAAPLIAQTVRNGVADAAVEDLERSGRVFDSVRGEFTDLVDEIQRQRDDAHDELDRRTQQLAIVTALASLLTALGVTFTWFGLKRWVLVPLDRIGSDARAVAGGELRRPISPVGPPELRQIAEDAEAMRQRIVDELGLVEEARTRLETQAADLERSNQELEQFAYVASHDLQEPLRKVTGFCQLLQRRYSDQLDERADEYIEYAVDGAKRMQRLINDLLAFSRVGRTTERFEPVDLNAVVRAVEITMRDRIEESGATLTAPELPTVAGDPTLLEVLFQNVVANGLKFRGEDPPVVEITVRRTGESWEFACRDNGIGIEPQHAEKVFVIFQRLNDRDAYSGTGIGLAMCRKVVEFHGGRIWVDTEAHGRGTTIRWTMPVAVDAQPAHVAVAELLEETEPAEDPTVDGAAEPSQPGAEPATTSVAAPTTT